MYGVWLAVQLASDWSLAATVGPSGTDTNPALFKLIFVTNYLTMSYFEQQYKGEQ